MGGEFGAGAEAAALAVALAVVFITSRFLVLIDWSRAGRCDQKIGTSCGKGFGGFASFSIMLIYKSFLAKSNFSFFSFGGEGREGGPKKQNKLTVWRGWQSTLQSSRDPLRVC